MEVGYLEIALGSDVAFDSSLHQLLILPIVSGSYRWSADKWLFDRKFEPSSILLKSYSTGVESHRCGLRSQRIHSLLGWIIIVALLQRTTLHGICSFLPSIHIESARRCRRVAFSAHPRNIVYHNVFSHPLHNNRCDTLMKREIEPEHRKR